MGKYKLVRLALIFRTENVHIEVIVTNSEFYT